MLSRIAQGATLRVPLRAFSSRNRGSDEIGVTLTVQISKNGASFATPNSGSSAVEIGNGWYYKDLNATDTGTLGPLVIRATGSQIGVIEPQPLLIVLATNAGWTALPDSIWPYVATDTAGTTTLLARLTGTRAGLLDNLNVALSTRAAPGDAMALTSAYDAAQTAAQAGDAMALTSDERTTLVAAIWAGASRTLTSVGTLVADIWASVTDSSGVTTLLGRLSALRATQLDHLDVDISSRLASGSYTAPDNTAIVAIQAQTDLLPISPASQDTLVLVQAKTDLIPAAGPPDAAHYTNARGDLMAHLDVDISSRLAAADYTPPGDLSNLDVAISSRLATVSYTAPDNLTIEAIHDDTQELLFGGGGGGGSGATPDEVKAKMVEALSDDTYGEPGQEAPGATVSLAYKLGWLYKLSRNRLTQTPSTTQVYNDAATVVDHKTGVSYDGTTFVRDEFQSGP